MNLKTFFALSVLAIFTGLSLQASDTTQKPLLTEDDVSWDSLSSADDKIRISRKEIPGSDIVAFRGETVMNHSIGKIATVLNDSKRKTEWVHNAEEASDIEIISPLERYEYNHTGTPVGLTDRDFVFHAKVGLNKAKKQMTIIMKSVDHPKAPKTKYVRGNIIRGTYILTMIDSTHTNVEVEFQADPMGSIPKWIVNLFQKSWPQNTLEGINRQAAKADVAENQDVKMYFESNKVPENLKKLVSQAESTTVHSITTLSAPLKKVMPNPVSNLKVQ